MNKYDVIIVGAGPAGLTAGIYSARSGLKTLILERLDAGGQIVLTEHIENFPGIKQAPTRELVDIMKEQAQGFGVKIELDEVVKVESQGKEFLIKGSKDYETKAVIIASGALPRRLNLAAEEKFIGRGVSYCAVCDGPFFRNKEVCVIGGGNAAVEEAMYLTKFVTKVYLVHRRRELRAVKSLQDKLLENKKIEVIWDSVVTDIIGDKTVSAVKLKNLLSDKITELAIQGIFIFVGFEPHTNIFANLVKLEEGFIITDDAMKTTKDGIFACGDCRKKSLRQVITACGDGAQAADSAFKYINLG